MSISRGSTYLIIYLSAVCEYFAHIECQDFAVPDCTENATYVPGKELLNVKHQVSAIATLVRISNG